MPMRVSHAGTAGILTGALQHEADRHAAVGIGVGDGIGARAAIQGVVAIAAVQCVIAGEAVDHIVVVVAGERVVEGRAGQVLEIG